jgi:hypothetical protein
MYNLNNSNGWEAQNGNPCAGIDRHEAENARVLRERNSRSTGPRLLRHMPRGIWRSIKQRYRLWARYRASRNCNQDVDAGLGCIVWRRAGFLNLTCSVRVMKIVWP